ncbi:MAG: flagellar basal body rod protein FlgC [Legionellales bacterium]|nr:flagellar basal body rod protein FlgC [Legionellales bacterium]
MSLEIAMRIASSGMSAQTVRLNTTASNFANANVSSRTEEGAYRALNPVFSTVMSNEMSAFDPLRQAAQGVGVTQIVKSDAPIDQKYDPTNVNANEKGYVYLSNVNTFDETANMLSASKDYRMNLEMFVTLRNMTQRALSVLEN